MFKKFQNNKIFKNNNNKIKKKQKQKQKQSKKKKEKKKEKKKKKFNRPINYGIYCTFYYCICKFEVFQRRAIRVVVVGYIGHCDSLPFLDTWMPFCVTKYYHVFVSFNLLCLKTLKGNYEIPHSW
jgi:hypothetical protein